MKNYYYLKLLDIKFIIPLIFFFLFKITYVSSQNVILEIEGTNINQIFRDKYSIEIADNDFPHQMHWKNAMAACQRLGNGWRLPSYDELYYIHHNATLKNEFKEGWYWTNELDTWNGGLGRARYVDFSSQYQGGGSDFNESPLASFRAVRNLNSVERDSLLSLQMTEKQLTHDDSRTPLETDGNELIEGPEDSYKVDPKFTFYFNGKNIELSEWDFPSVMTWDEGKKACHSLGNKWRLPTLWELEVIHNEFYKMGKANLKGVYGSSSLDYSDAPVYWSSSLDYSDAPQCFDFRRGTLYNYGHSLDKDEMWNVRAVRTLPSMPQKAKPTGQVPQVESVEDTDNKEDITEITQDTRIEVTPVVEMEEEIASEPLIYTVVEEMPSFPGGDQELLKFMADNLKYPPLARENGLQGIVVVTFEVDARGKIDKVQVLRGIGGGCDEEAIRVMKAMPRWKPGNHRGMPVRVQYNLPFRFTLR